MMSENNLGPKLYGIFESGQIMAYYKHKTFDRVVQSDPKVVENVAKRLAQIHAMDIPIKKSGNSYMEALQ
ncbi:unnamed protein product, partial [Oppiella nova]